MSEKNNHDFLGLPEGKDSFRLDDVSKTAVSSLIRALSIPRGLTEKSLGIAQSVIDRVGSTASTAVFKLKTVSDSLSDMAEVIRNAEPSLGDHTTEDHKD